MGFEMSKPFLRSSPEAVLQGICDGVKNNDAVLTYQINKYKDLFAQSMYNQFHMDRAMEHVTGEAPANQLGADIDIEIEELWSVRIFLGSEEASTWSDCLVSGISHVSRFSASVAFMFCS